MTHDEFKKEMKELSERTRKMLAELDEELDKYPGQSIIDLHKIDSIEDYFSPRTKNPWANKVNKARLRLR